MQPNSMFLTVACVSLLWLAGQAHAQDVTCNKTSACSCAMSDGSGIVNLHPVEVGKPTYKDLLATVNKDDYLYSWNPCTPFSEGPAGDESCTNMAACQISKNQSHFYGLGTHDSVQYAVDTDPDSGRVVVVAVYQIPGEQGRSSEVLLKCSSGATTFTVLGELQQGQYIFQLESPCCCPGADASCIGGGLSAGSILLIVAISVVAVYFVGGVIIMKFVKGAEGAEVIPNSSFWSSLPGYVKDGVLFVVSPCRKSGKYDSI